MFLKPASPDIRVPDPSQQGTPGYWLPGEGREVESSMYWARRLIDGDVVEAPAPAAAASQPAVALPSAPSA
jgi:hypothetical protein